MAQIWFKVRAAILWIQYFGLMMACLVALLVELVLVVVFENVHDKFQLLLVACKYIDSLEHSVKIWKNSHYPYFTWNQLWVIRENPYWCNSAVNKLIFWLFNKTKIRTFSAISVTE